MKRVFPLLILIAIAISGCDWMYEPATPENAPPQTTPSPVAQVEPAKETLEILDFYATWCGPCAAQKPKMLLIEASGYEVTRLDVDKETDRANEYNIHSVPTYVVLINGKEKYRTQNAFELADWLKNHERSVQKAKGRVRNVSKATRTGEAGSNTPAGN